MVTQYLSNRSEAGCDEAGRGCLAGPVFAAAVILPVNFKHPLLRDSKQLSEKQRAQMLWVIQTEAIDYHVASVSPEEIDEINILQASFLAMHRALDGLKTQPEHILVDGNRFNPYGEIPHQCMVKGDSRFGNIAAASILAKYYRDAYMLDLSEKYPDYAWASNKGYPTKAHRAAIAQHGITEFHRRSFKLLPD